MGIINDKKTFWMLGAMAIFILLMCSVGVIGGTAFYVFSRQTKKETVTNSPNYPKQPVTTPTQNKPATDSEKLLLTDKGVKVVFETKKVVGKYQIVSIFEKRSAEYFPAADGQSGAMYMGKQKNENIIIIAATYSSREKAKSEFTEMIAGEKKGGAKMIVDNLEKDDTINAVYQRGVLSVISFCNFRNENLTVCYRIAATDRNVLVDFHDNFFAK